MLHIITSDSDKLLLVSTSMTLNDLEPPKIWVFSEFWLFSAATHILRAPKWLEMDLDNLRMTFLA